MGLSFKLGLKLYSTNTDLINKASKLHEDGIFYYVELYVIPGSYEKKIDAWKNFNISYIIHAPHSFHGVNLAQEEKWQTNLQHFNETRRFADELDSDIIIVHGGNNGSFEETIREIRLLDDQRIVLENKPKVGLFDEECVGWSPSEFQMALETGAISGTVLDFVHATCAACSMQVETITLINEFLKFNPKLFHLSDGDTQSQKDMHLNFGKGNLNLKEFLASIPKGSLLTLETPRDPAKGLTDFENDVIFLRKVS